MNLSIDQLGKMGQREIARSYAACVRLLWSAGGAGVVMVGALVLKLRIIYAPLTLFGGGLALMANFVTSFLLMQALGLRLATKQSPLLGAALGRGEEPRPSDMRWSFRTQASSAAGNILFVFVASLLIQWLFRKISGRGLMDEHAALAALSSHHAWESAALPYAAFTGVLLWACAWAGGAVANRCKPFSKTTASMVFNIGLGTLLAFMPALGKWLHLPIDVRHFTISGGFVAMAVGTLGISQAWAAGLGPAIIGVFAIGVLNFSVSFALAFMTARIHRGTGGGGGMEWPGTPLLSSRFPGAVPAY
jgi:site-specific recombinase